MLNYNKTKAFSPDGNEKPAWRKIGRGITEIFLFLIICFLIILIRSFLWLRKVFGEISFSTVVYQLMSPMKGTSADILWNYVFSCIILSVLIAVAIWFMYRIISYRLSKRNFIVDCAFRFAYMIITLGICGALLGKSVIQAGVPEYIEDMTDVSFLFEEEYVDPNNVEIIFPASKRNLILVYLESMESTYASMENDNGDIVDYVPELTLLSKENVHFSDSDDLGGAGAYGNTGWTMAGLLASSMGVPYKLGIGGNEAGEYENFLPGITGLGDILEKEGYSNYFMCGSDAIFGGRSDFYAQHGEYTIYDYNTAIKDGFIESDYYEFWGMEDEKLYEYAQEKLTEIASYSEPFNFTMLTVDTHHPQGYVCGLCQDRHSEQYGNVISCASKQIYEFILWVQEQEWYEDTAIVLTGDHLSMNIDFFDHVKENDRKIYNCFINASLPTSEIRSLFRKFSTMDMFPTILVAMGAKIEGERLGLGTNLFSDRDTLAEELMGFDDELNKYSNYYIENFISVDGEAGSWLMDVMQSINGYNYMKTWYPGDQQIWKEGFGTPEGKRIWMVGDESIVEIPIEAELSARDLEVDVNLVVHGVQQSMKVMVDGKVLYDEVLSEDVNDVSFSVPRNMIDGNTVVLHFSHPDAVSPKELNHGPDERRLSFCVYKIRVKNKK